MTVFAPMSAGWDALRRRLQNLPQAAQAAVGEALQELAVAAGDEIAAALPTDTSATVGIEIDPDGIGCRLTVDAAALRAFEFGTSQTEARPILRPLVAAATERAKPAIAEALRRALVEARA